MGVNYGPGSEAKWEPVRVHLESTELLSQSASDARALIVRHAKYKLCEFVGYVLKIEGRFAQPRLTAEEGVHDFVMPSTQQAVYVHATEAAFKDYEPPQIGISRDFTTAAARRTYKLKDKSFVDYALKKTFAWTLGSFEDNLVLAINELLKQKLEAML
jgi:hypothetical protein